VADDREVRAIRCATALSVHPEIHFVRFRDPAPLEGICTSELGLRDGEAVHTLLLGGCGELLADAYVLRNGDEFVLLADGPSRAELDEHLTRFARGGEWLDDSHELFWLHGPWSWELLGEITGPQVVSLPRGTLFDLDGVWCMRASRTGEYGYALLAPRERSSALAAELERAGKSWDLVRVGPEAIAQCALENGIFDIHAEGRIADMTAFELGLGWRIARAKPFVGDSALRSKAIAERLVWLIAEGPIAKGDVLLHHSRAIGAVVKAGYSSGIDAWVGVARAPAPLAHPGVDRFVAHHEGKDVRLRTISPPLVNNQSLHIDPRRDTYASRQTIAFPALGAT
jgi:glycine cleavage system aminomethyltransferase T